MVPELDLKLDLLLKTEWQENYCKKLKIENTVFFQV